MPPASENFTQSWVLLMRVSTGFWVSHDLRIFSKVFKFHIHDASIREKYIINHASHDYISRTDHVIVQKLRYIGSNTVIVCFFSVCSKVLSAFNSEVYSYHICISAPICATVPLSNVSGYIPGNYGLVQVFVGATTVYSVVEIMIPI